ncbi:MAG: hypothetical protein WC700_01470 [Gemmatimonadaceae bacterium]|jgi:hypothetical protein
MMDAAVARSAVSASALGPGAPKLIVSVTDAMGDAIGSVPFDVSRMDLIFDRTTGAYEITIRTHPSGPFIGAFRINLNLFNIDALSYFKDTGNDFNLSSPVPTLVLSGPSSLLTLWQPGEHVNTNSLFPGAPNPPGSSVFRSGVGELPLCGFLCREDLIAFVNLAQPAIVEVLESSDQVGLLQEEVNDLIAQGVLSPAQAEGLLAKLAAILDKIEKGQLKAASNQLGAFSNQVSAFANAGLLTEAQAKHLMDAAAYAAAQL